MTEGKELLAKLKAEAGETHEENVEMIKTIAVKLMERSTKLHVPITIIVNELPLGHPYIAPCLATNIPPDYLDVLLAVARNQNSIIQ